MGRPTGAPEKIGRQVKHRMIDWRRHCGLNPGNPERIARSYSARQGIGNERGLHRITWFVKPFYNSRLYFATYQTLTLRFSKRKSRPVC